MHISDCMVSLALETLDLGVTECLSKSVTLCGPCHWSKSACLSNTQTDRPQKDTATPVPLVLGSSVNHI